VRNRREAPEGEPTARCRRRRFDCRPQADRRRFTSERARSDAGFESTFVRYKETIFFPNYA